MAQVKTAPKPAPKSAATAATVVEKTKKEMAEATPRPTHNGATAATYRVGKKLTALRKDTKAGTMNNNDVDFIREVVEFGGKARKFERRNLDAGRIGRLFTFKMVDFEETGVYDPAQIITVLPAALSYVKQSAAA